jgi:hypothetical protein
MRLREQKDTKGERKRGRRRMMIHR